VAASGGGEGQGRGQRQRRGRRLEAGKRWIKYSTCWVCRLPTSPVHLNENGRAKVARAVDQMPTMAVNVSVCAEPRGDLCFLPSLPPRSTIPARAGRNDNLAAARLSADYCLFRSVNGVRRHTSTS